LDVRLRRARPASKSNVFIRLTPARDVESNLQKGQFKVKSGFSSQHRGLLGEQQSVPALTEP